MNSQPQTGRRPMELALTFLQIALLSFGGGLSAHAFNILVEKKCWLGREEFLSFLAISRLLPGANMVNLAVCIGNRCGGAGGAVAAVAGLLLVPLLLVLLPSETPRSNVLSGFLLVGSALLWSVVSVGFWYTYPPLNTAMVVYPVLAVVSWWAGVLLIDNAKDELFKPEKARGG